MKKKKVLASILLLCLLAIGSLIYIMRYQQLSNILGDDFNDKFILHNITITSAIPAIYGTEDPPNIDQELAMIRRDFHERHASSSDRLYGHEWYSPGHVINDTQVADLLELLLSIRIRPYNLSAHPIMFNANYFSGSDIQEVNPQINVLFQIFDIDKQIVLMIAFQGSNVFSILSGEVTEYGWGGNKRFGFNPTIFKVHEDDNDTIFEILRVLDSNAPEIIGFELD